MVEVVESEKVKYKFVKHETGRGVWNKNGPKAAWILVFAR